MKKDDDLDATLSPKSWTQIISSTLDEKRRQRINDSAKDGLAELEKVDEQATSEVLGKAVIGRQNEIQESLSDEEIEEIEREKEIMRRQDTNRSRRSAPSRSKSK